MKSAMDRLNHEAIDSRMKVAAKGIRRLTKRKKQHERSETEECTSSSKELHLGVQVMSPPTNLRHENLMRRDDFMRAQSTKHLVAEANEELAEVPPVPLVVTVPRNYVDDISVIPDPVLLDDRSTVQHPQKESLASRVRNILGMKKSEREKLSSTSSNIRLDEIQNAKLVDYEGKKSERQHLRSNSNDIHLRDGIPNSKPDEQSPSKPRGSRPEFTKSSSLRLPQHAVHWEDENAGSKELQRSKSLRKVTFHVDDSPLNDKENQRSRDQAPSSPRRHRPQFTKCQSERGLSQRQPSSRLPRQRTIKPDDSPQPVKDMVRVDMTRSSSVRAINLDTEQSMMNVNLRRGNTIEIGKKTRKRSTASKQEHGPSSRRDSSNLRSQRPRHALRKAQSERLIVEVN